ncbi:MAG: hypothetical protein J7L25_02320 [Deltaproteobacteria bacterium]|nr:hypothetical protein [Candidatus Tharpella aukensis]
MNLKLFRKSPKVKLLKEVRGDGKNVKSIPIWLFTICYLIFVGMLILGVKTGPFQDYHESIPMTELSENIPIFIFFYVLLLGFIKLNDYLNTKRRRNTRL